MINQVKIELPYPLRVGFFSLNLKRSVWLRFDNLALFMFREKQNITNGTELNEWFKNNGQYELFVHGCYHAVESYCLHNRLKFDLDLKKFAIGLSQLPKDEMQNLLNTWKRSQSFGSAEIPGKKKVTAKN